MPVYAIGRRTPTLPETGRFWIAPDAHVIGEVSLGEDVSIWFGAVLRGDNDVITIGRGSNIQEGAMLHTDSGLRLIVGNAVTVGHHAILHGCQVGDNSLIGMGATVLNRARIGANCLVGANTLVREGDMFPDGSLIVGTPAQVKRKLSETQIAGLRASAEHYVEKSRTFARGLQRLD
jgi:carbonic anhydrase/acetyltransferase-like protein (isoleucine patch superfamily)